MEISIVKGKNYPETRKLYDAFKVSEKGTICLAIGGDGTFVRAAREFEGPILPIRSGEKGSIGYYSDVSLKDIDFIIKNLKLKNYTVEELGNKIEIRYSGKSYYAVNELVFHNIREEVSFKIYEMTKGSRELLYPYIMSGDGVFVTGVIGSTAYNKSAGGPIILAPSAICMTFLNVDGPYKNPIVIDSSKEFEIEVSKYSGVLRCDGLDIATLHKGAKFRIRISNKGLKILRFRGKRENLASKLERIIKSRMISDYDL